MEYNLIPAQDVIDKTAAALKANNIETIIVNNGAEAKQKALELLPAGAEVMNMTSVTVDTIGLTQEINESGKYNTIRSKFEKMDKATQGSEMRKLGAGPDWAIGSVHAVTQDGHAIIASATGSQLPAYAYGAGNVIWIVGAQKIVENVEAGMKRIYNYTLELEAVRARKAYNIPADKPGSAVNKLLIFNKEYMPGRVTMILVKEVLGF